MLCSEWSELSPFQIRQGINTQKDLYFRDLRIWNVFELMMEDRRSAEMTRRLLNVFSVVHVKEQDPLLDKFLEGRWSQMKFWCLVQKTDSL